MSTGSNSGDNDQNIANPTTTVPLIIVRFPFRPTGYWVQTGSLIGVLVCGVILTEPALAQLAKPKQANVGRIKLVNKEVSFGTLSQHGQERDGGVKAACLTSGTRAIEHYVHHTSFLYNVQFLSVNERDA